MEILKKPEKNLWTALCERPQLNQRDLKSSTRDILEKVKQGGDTALLELTEAFDGVKLDHLQVSPAELKAAQSEVSKELAAAIQLAFTNIEKFHLAQKSDEVAIETSRGVKCWRRALPIEKVGLYIPGGSAPLFSTILMLGIPAKIAGCEEIVLCSPPDKNGKIDPAILFTAQLVGCTKIFKLGGAQAIAALAYGSESVPAVYKIFGPGNQYVTKAKEMVQEEGLAIDMPAGPSELLLIADASCEPSYVAADLLSQAEHGPDSQVILLSNKEDILWKCIKELEVQIEKLPRKEIALKAIRNSRAILLEKLEDCLAFSNQYAPEHLIIASEDAEKYALQIRNAGSVFLGNYSCESAGDYASGTNHTLPTNGYARNYSGVSLQSFQKQITFQSLSKAGLQLIGPSIEVMAEAEGLWAHKNAVSIRLKNLNNEI